MAGVKVVVNGRGDHVVVTIVGWVVKQQDFGWMRKSFGGGIGEAK